MTRSVEKLTDLAEEAMERGDEKEYRRLWDIAERSDPWNDLFHLTCRHFPNCNTEGCIED